MATTWSMIGTRSAKVIGCTGTEAAPAAPVQASTTVAFSTAVAGNTVTLRGSTFTALANGATPASNFGFAVGTGGTADTDTGTAFAAAINATTYLHGCTATNASGTVTVKAVEYGTGPNAWTLTKEGDPITLGAATLGSGVDLLGVPLDDVAQVHVAVEAVAGQTVVNGSLFAYWLNPWTMLWARVPSLDVAIGAVAYRCVAGAPSAAIAGEGRLAYLPSGTTISSGTAIVYMSAITKTDATSRATRA